MPNEYDGSLEDDFISFAYVLLTLAIVWLLWVVVPVVLREIGQVIRWRHQAATAFSKKLEQIVAFNRIESYKAEEYCTVCYSSATCRCNICGAVAYCSKKCQRDHWKEGHMEECRLMTKGEDNDESNKTRDSFGVRDKKEHVTVKSSCAAELWFWPEFDVTNFEGCEGGRRIRYVEEEEEECHRQPSTSESSDCEVSTFFESESSSSFDQKRNPQVIDLTSDEKSIPKHSCTNSYSQSKELCCNKCQVIFFCISPEHCQRSEGINGNKEEQDDIEESTEESEIEHSISHLSQTLGVSATDDQSPRRVIRIKHSTLGRSSSSSSNDSSSPAWSMYASGSDAISSLHGLD